MVRKEEKRKQHGGLHALLAAVAVAVTASLAGCGHGNKDFRAATLNTDNMAEETAPADTVAAPAPHPAAPEVPVKQGPRYHDHIRVNNIGPLSKVFNDSNKYQYAAAERLGIDPMQTVALSYFTKRPIVHVTSNEFYTIDTLKHSFPYLVPEAEKLLRDIGRNFIDSLRRRGGDSYRILVTSLLRSPHTVKRLRHVNRNAVDSSTHQFGTTFDISYVRFHNTNPERTLDEGDLKNLLGEVLLDLRNANRCLVKYERTGGCYHITATR